MIAARDEAAPAHILAVADTRILGQTARSFELIDGKTLTRTTSTPFEFKGTNSARLFWYAASADTRWAATLEIDGSLVIYDVDKQLVRTRMKLDAPVGTDQSDIALSPDGAQLVYANGTVQRYDVASGKAQGRAQTLPTSTQKILFSPQGERLAAVQPNGEVMILDTRVTRRIASPPLTLKTGFTEVRILSFSPTGTHVGISDGRATLALWALNSGNTDTPLREFNLTELVLPVFDDTAQHLALVSNTAIRIVNIDSGETEQTLTLAPGIGPTSAYFDRTGETIYVAGINTLTQFKVADGSVVQTASRAPVSHVALTADGARVVSWGTWNAALDIAIWQTSDGQPIARLPHTAAVRWVVLGSAQKHLASITVDNTIHVWVMNVGGEVLSLAAPTTQTQRALLCLADADETVVFIEGDTLVRQPVQRGKPSNSKLPAGSRGYTPCQNSAQRIAVVTAEAIQVFDISAKADDKPIADIPLPAEAPELRNNLQIILSNDGQQLAAASEKEIFVWAIDTGKLLARTAISRPALFGLIFGPDGKKLAVNYGDAADVVDIQSGVVTSLQIPMKPQARWVNLQFAADPEVIIMAARLSSTESAQLEFGKRKYVDGEISLWDAKTGKLLHTLKQTGLVHSIAVSEDGAVIATGTQSEQLTIWGVR